MVFQKSQKQLCLFFIILITSNYAWATFSIVACESKTKACGAGVVTNNLAVGASVIYAEAGVGAIATQFETNPHYGPVGLSLIQGGVNAKESLNALLEQDDCFDGGSVDDRQVAIVSLSGGSASHTGKHALASVWAGTIETNRYTIQGNGLVGRNVLVAMQRAFLSSKGELAERVLAALSAGQLAGGQATGSMSAAVLVRTPIGFPHDIDFRVDNSSRPVIDLNELLDLHYARQLIIKAERIGRLESYEQAMPALELAIKKGSQWDRIWRRAARLAVSHQRYDEAIRFLTRLKVLNARWFEIEIKQPMYQPIRHKIN